MTITGYQSIGRAPLTVLAPNQDQATAAFLFATAPLSTAPNLPNSQAQRYLPQLCIHDSQSERSLLDEYSCMNSLDVQGEIWLELAHNQHLSTFVERLEQNLARLSPEVVLCGNQELLVEYDLLHVVRRCVLACGAAFIIVDEADVPACGGETLAWYELACDFPGID